MCRLLRPCVQVLRQDQEFDALQWFDSARAHFAAEQARLKVCAYFPGPCGEVCAYIPLHEPAADYLVVTSRSQATAEEAQRVAAERAGIGQWLSGLVLGEAKVRKLPVSRTSRTVCPCHAA